MKMYINICIPFSYLVGYFAQRLNLSSRAGLLTNLYNMESWLFIDVKMFILLMSSMSQLIWSNSIVLRTLAIEWIKVKTDDFREKNH